ncbi:HNH endonuclease [Shewanella sp. 4t3-1-2LB]|uniref:HNH endonuclease n=1 Tax=Shewanella sp. 4t3-1-2LB TaxID=2817682 RepID=UPI001A98A174|nr:HNH endonuclease [Shewanella sp. 4t3-1-2LB]MBO1271601.1 HNH endonuclease [Shewanella sp. 4t3-1-2LB]
MQFTVHVTFRIGSRCRSRHYQTEFSAKRGIYKWLEKNQHQPDISASYFSPDSGHQTFQQLEQLSEYAPKPVDNFYLSRAWLDLRHEVLSSREHRCNLCHRSVAEHGIALEVDHILPRSRYPELALDINNLQILCYECNRGKRDK